MPMLQPVASTSPLTSPGFISAAVRLMLSREKPVGEQTAAATASPYGTHAKNASVPSEIARLFRLFLNSELIPIKRTIPSLFAAPHLDAAQAARLNRAAAPAARCRKGPIHNSGWPDATN